MADDDSNVAGDLLWAALKKWGIPAIGGTTLAIIILVIAILGAVAAFLGGGDSSLDKTAPPSGGTALTRSAEWLPALKGGSLPNAVTLAVMEHESAGQILARNYNFPGNRSGSKEDQYGPNVQPLSLDAGLMQINSGGWPVPEHAAKWQALKMADNPYDPATNIPAGVNELNGDYGSTAFLKYALEDYNSGKTSGDDNYAASVRSTLDAVQSGPAVAVWATANWDHDAGEWHLPTDPGVETWVMVSAVAPYGAKWSVDWKPSPPDSKGHPQPPVQVKGLELMLPTRVTIRGPGGGIHDMALSPPDSPVWPGASAWCYRVKQPGKYYVRAYWPGTGKHSAVPRTRGSMIHLAAG